MVDMAFQAALRIYQKAYYLRAEEVSGERFADLFFKGSSFKFPTYQVKVDYNLTIETVVKTFDCTLVVNHFDRTADYVNSDRINASVSSRVKSQGTREVSISLIKVMSGSNEDSGHRIDQEPLEAMVRSLGFRFASTRELVWLGAKHPEIYRSYHTACMDFLRYKGAQTRVPFLRRGSTLSLDVSNMFRFENPYWSGDMQFAVVPMNRDSGSSSASYREVVKLQKAEYHEKYPRDLDSSW